MFRLEPELARWAVLFFALSIIFATWVLGAIPSIVMRMEKDDQNFYQMGMFEWRPFVWIPFWVFTFSEHIFFVIGIVCFMLSIRNKL
jgi:hypothetical protein